MNPQNGLIKLSLGIILSLSVASANALTSDSEQPIYISAKSANINQQTGQGVYEGLVSVTQGSSHLSATKAYTFTDNSNELIKAVAHGQKKQQARFTTKTAPDKPQLVASADEITYLPKDNKIILAGNAKVQQGNDSFSAPRIEYDTLKQHVASNSNAEQRTTIVIHPKKSRKPTA